jgi:predicted CXXCH cytochrome family protein
MKALIIALSCCLMLFLLAGCEAKSSYKVLSFFFDGVPNPDEPVPEKGAARKQRLALAAEKGSKMGSYRDHGPYGAKRCEACHEKATNKLVMPVEQLCFKCHTFDVTKKHVHGPLASGGCRVCHLPHGSSYDFLLVSDPKEFCLYCHDKTIILKSDIHREAEGQQCTVCHDAHSSDTEYLLK